MDEHVSVQEFDFLFWNLEALRNAVGLWIEEFDGIFEKSDIFFQMKKTWQDIRIEAINQFPFQMLELAAEEGNLRDFIDKAELCPCQLSAALLFAEEYYLKIIIERFQLDLKDCSDTEIEKALDKMDIDYYQLVYPEWLCHLIEVDLPGAEECEDHDDYSYLSRIKRNSCMASEYNPPIRMIEVTSCAVCSAITNQE